MIKSSNLKREDTRIEYAKYLGLNTKANQFFVYEYNEVLNYVSKLDLGSGDLSFRLPAFVHNKDEQIHAHRMFKEAMNSMRIKSPSLLRHLSTAEKRFSRSGIWQITLAAHIMSVLLKKLSIFAIESVLKNSLIELIPLDVAILETFDDGSKPIQFLPFSEKF